MSRVRIVTSPRQPDALVSFDCFPLPHPVVRRPALSVALQDKPCPDTCSEEFGSCKQIYATSRRQDEAP
jgi:hypothetical protein